MRDSKLAVFMTISMVLVPIAASDISIVDMPEPCTPAMTVKIDEILDNFALLDQWDDRYRYVIELGRGLAELPDAARNEANKVQGCASQVWLETKIGSNGKAGPVLDFVGDSDAHIVRGLIAILFALYSGKPARDILSIDALAVFDSLGLREHLTPQRSNGLRSMVERIRADARAALATVA
jgi:cysteine desulfuration protein SufE